MHAFFGDRFPSYQTTQATIDKNIKTWVKAHEKEIQQYSDEADSTTKTQLKAALEEYSMCNLKGGSGTGKTQDALSYGQEEDCQLFVGIAQLIAWLKSVPKNQEKLVWILDEANMEPPGSLDFLKPLLYRNRNQKTIKIFFRGEIYTLTCQHQVIFTTNP